MSEEEKVSEESLRMSYLEICHSYHAVRDAQLKLLALLPVVMGAAVSLLINKELHSLHFYVLGLLGAFFTIGIYLYGIRADQHAIALSKHGAFLESELKLPKGQFKDRPAPRFGGYTLALTLIYAALLFAWLCIIYMGWLRR